MAATPTKNYATYWGIVWEQFRKNGLSYTALWAIGLLFALAIYAPAIASKMPFLWWEEETGYSSPWLSSLLFNRNVFASGIDLFFNLVMVLSPFWLASMLICKRAFAKLDYKERPRAWQIYWLAWAGLLLAAYIVILWIEPMAAIPEYRELDHATLSQWSLFPPIRVQYDDTLNGYNYYIESLMLEAGIEPHPGIGEETFAGMIHPMGLDNSGRDIFVRLLYGTRVSLSVGVIAVSIYITIGTVLGALAGYFGGWTDILIQRVIEIFLSFPRFFMILTFIGFLDQPSITWMMIIIGLIGWTGSARLVRGEFLRLKNIDFVAAARACGLSNTRIIFRHILPNAVGPVLVNATFGVAAAVLIETSLSFLGFGDPTLPSWGRILAYGRSTGSTQMMLIAGGAIFVTVSLFNLAGEGVRDALDPKLRK